MRALPSLLAFLAALALRLNVYGAQAAEDASRVGVVDKVENEAQVISASGAVTATVGAPVHLKDELRTGANARLQVTFLDETQLTLGEHASVVSTAMSTIRIAASARPCCKRLRALFASQPAASRR